MAVPTEPVDLLTGWPNPALLPAPDLLRSATTVLTDPSIANPALLYGPDEGPESLRVHIAQWLNSFYRPHRLITPHRICITGGASQSLACILHVFTDPLYTRNVFMVDPTYHLAGRMVDDAGFARQTRRVPEDEEGIDLNYLENALRIAEAKAAAEGNTEPTIKPPRPWRKIYKYIIYAVPTFSNPATKIMSLGHRERLVRLARTYDALLVTDDVYDFLQWSVTPGGSLTSPDQACVPRLVDVDGYLDGGPVDEWGHAISNGSFSKLLGPGARTGWVEASDKVAYGVSQVGCSRSGGCASQLSSTIIDQLLPSGFLENHIRHVLQPAYAERYHLLLSAVQEHLEPLGVTIAQASTTVAGGYFMWISIPSPLSAGDIVAQAQKEENLRLAPGTLFEVQGDPHAKTDRFASQIRLCFAWAEPRHLTEGVRRLSRVLQRALQSNSN